MASKCFWLLGPSEAKAGDEIRFVMVGRDQYNNTVPYMDFVSALDVVKLSPNSGVSISAIAGDGSGAAVVDVR